jgi:transcriptional regulator with XRE-family HTH domain
MNDKAKQWDECLHNIGASIRKAREEKKLSVPELAQQSGMTEDEYRELEHGDKQDPDLRSMSAVARALGASIDDLLPKQWPRLKREDIKQEPSNVIHDHRS